MTIGWMSACVLLTRRNNNLNGITAVNCGRIREIAVVVK